MLRLKPDIIVVVSIASIFSFRFELWSSQYNILIMKKRLCLEMKQALKSIYEILNRYR